MVGWTRDSGWRRTLLPGAVAAVGSVLWVVDALRPVVARIDLHGSAELHLSRNWVRTGEGFSLPPGTTAASLTWPPEPVTANEPAPAAVGQVLASTPVQDGTVITIVEGGTTAADRGRALITRTSPSGAVEVGPAFEAGDTIRLTAITANRVLLRDHVLGSSTTRLRTITPDLILGEPVIMSYLGRMWTDCGRLWTHAHEAGAGIPRREWTPAQLPSPWATGHHPTRVDGAPGLGILLELDPDTLRPTFATYVPAPGDFLTHVTATTDGTVWIRLLSQDEPWTDHDGDQLLRWHPGDPAGAQLVDMADLIGTEPELTLPVTLPDTAPADLDAWAADCARRIARQLRGGLPDLGVSFDSTSVVAGFPFGHVIAQLHHRDVPHPIGIAYQLFDEEGRPDFQRHDWRLIELEEQLLTTYAVSHLRTAEPDADGMVWLVPPRSPHGRLG